MIIVPCRICGEESMVDARKRQHDMCRECKTELKSAYMPTPDEIRAECQKIQEERMAAGTWRPPPPERVVTKCVRAHIEIPKD